MKKSFVFVLSLIMIAMLSSSCKKDHTCTCSYKNLGGTSGSFSFEIEDSSRKDAKEACNAYLAIGWLEGECKLK